jgi:hypothetical protein
MVRQVTTSLGQDGRPNVNWECKPTPEFLPAHAELLIPLCPPGGKNEMSGRRGISLEKVYPVN